MLKKIMLAISLLTFAVAGAKAETIEEVMKRGELRVGLSSFVPWAFVNKKGELAGFEVDVAKELAKDLGVKIKIINTAWDGIIPSLQSKKFDFIIGGMSVTTKRNLTINFTEAYDGIEYVVLVNKKHANKTLKELNSRKFKFAGRRGAVPAKLTKQFFPKAKLLQFDDDGVAAQELLAGRIDALVETALVAVKTKDKSNGSIVFLNDGKAIFKGLSAMGVRKGNPDTMNVLNNWIRSKLNTGWLQKRSRYWFKTQDWKDQLPK